MRSVFLGLTELATLQGMQENRTQLAHARQLCPGNSSRQRKGDLVGP